MELRKIYVRAHEDGIPCACMAANPRATCNVIVKISCSEKKQLIF